MSFKSCAQFLRRRVNNVRLLKRDHASNALALIRFLVLSRFASTVHELATNYQGKLKVMKMNIDENGETAARYNIRGIPALLIFKGGELTDHIVGALPKDALNQRVSEALI